MAPVRLDLGDMLVLTGTDSADQVASWLFCLQEPSNDRVTVHVVHGAEAENVSVGLDGLWDDWFNCRQRKDFGISEVTL